MWMKAMNSIPRKKHTSLYFKCSWGPKAYRSIGPGFGTPGLKEINQKGIVELFNASHELSRWQNGKDSACQCRKRRRCWFSPWVRKIPWRREWQPTPVFLPGEFHGQGSLVGYSPRGHKESDTTEQAHNACHLAGCKMTLAVSTFHQSGIHSKNTHRNTSTGWWQSFCPEEQFENQESSFIPQIFSGCTVCEVLYNEWRTQEPRLPGASRQEEAP